MSLFGIDIQGIITDVFTDQLKPLTLTREIPGSYDPVTDEHTGYTTEEYHSEGIVSRFSSYMIANGFATSQERRILALAKPLNTTPKEGDKIEIEGHTYTVLEVLGRDPDTATFTMKGKV